MSHALPPPSAEAQLAFLNQLQRLFTEGDFVATYKFSLLIALADLAVELGGDDGNGLELSVRQIARRFIQNYWHQALPFSTGKPHLRVGVLYQNLGEKQATVITAIQEFKAQYGNPTFVQACKHLAFEKLVSKVATTVSAQPLNYLQNFGGTTTAFLYERQHGLVRLLPCVPFYLRRFYPLVQHLARSHWIEHIKRNHRNRSILGDTGDLESFLFETPKKTLDKVSKALLKLDGAKCFYCEERLTTAHVDHFIPFSKYPRDITQNFVLAHARCNTSKSNALASEKHLQRWLERLNQHAPDLVSIAEEAGVINDAQVILRVAQWSYSNAASSDGKAWVRPTVFEPITTQYLRHFSRTMA